jgi:uncharacterized protein (TIGR03000 family)
MSRPRSFALAVAALLSAAAVGHAGPPGWFSPAHQFPSSRGYQLPERSWAPRYSFTPSESYSRPSLTPAPGTSAQPPSQPPAHFPPPIWALEWGLVPRVLREPPPARTSAEIQVRVPDDAELWFNGARTQLTGTTRVFQSPPLEPGARYSYDVKARWTEGGKAVERTLRVPVAAGSRREVDFTK